MDHHGTATKYPMLMVHGVGFRDLKWPLYWGRIPGVLSGMGAELFYGQQDSWARVEDNAKTVKARIRQILDETGAGFDCFFRRKGYNWARESFGGTYHGNQTGHCERV